MTNTMLDMLCMKYIASKYANATEIRCGVGLITYIYFFSNMVLSILSKIHYHAIKITSALLHYHYLNDYTVTQ